MPSHVFAISKDSEAIAKKYGSNVSRGIAEMERRLEKYRDFVNDKKYGGEVE
jgi:hypothetical protein